MIGFQVLAKERFQVVLKAFKNKLVHRSLAKLPLNSHNLIVNQLLLSNMFHLVEVFINVQLKTFDH